jgi:dGTP triphosphohydrolase
MVKLELTEQQAKVLSEILDTFMSDLRMEIADTERKAWRDKMKEEEDFIKDLIKRLVQ